MRLGKWFISNLDDSQRQIIVRDPNESLIVQGAAGSGKTYLFDIPSDLPILQAIMSFYIKAQGFEQIERLMLNRKLQKKEFAFILWGAFIGFAAIPKTFTTVLY